jgi:hypothetical protein
MKMQRKLLSRESKNVVGRMSCGHLGSPKHVGQLFCHPKLIHNVGGDDNAYHHCGG